MGLDQIAPSIPFPKIETFLQWYPARGQSYVYDDKTNRSDPEEVSYSF
jgi:hypothetical protein